MGLTKEKDASAYKILARNNITERKVLNKIEKIRGEGVKDKEKSLSLTPRCKKILNLAMEEAHNLNQNFIGTEHILLGLTRKNKGVAARIISELDGDMDEIRKKLKAMIANKPKSKEKNNKNTDTPHLDKYSRDLTEMAKKEELDPVIGRKTEIQRIIQVLCRRTKNNPVLIGEAGVGKTAIVEGLTKKIANNDVPELLLNKRVISLDLGSLISGSKYRGEFEKRVKNIMKEINNSKNIILFIDELHTLVGAGAAEGSIDAANMLKPSLTRGELQAVGATTLDEYRKYIEDDPALERRFQSILVEENSPEESIEILYGLKDPYEAHHKVEISDKAVKAAVYLSQRYINDRFLPDKAIDVIDEAASKVKLRKNKNNYKNTESDYQAKDILQEKKTPVKTNKYNNAIEVKEEIKQDKLDDENQEKEEKYSSVVTEEDVADVVSSWTGIPVNKLEETETEKLLRLEDKLHERIVGQDEAVTAVSQAVRRARAGLKDPDRPIGSFVFLGPTGVGKTELARTLAEAMFDDEEAMIRIDMSEYMEKHSVSRLVGSPPGYVGHDEGGQLTEPVRRQPYSVVLFDEIEKAHPEVFNILLQILEDGTLTDTHGRKVDFKNTIVIMTSNVGANMIKNQSQLGFKVSDEDNNNTEYENMKDKVLKELKNTFRPEFLNRLDETIVFHSLNKDHIKQIIDFMLDDLRERLNEKEIEIKITDNAKDKLVDEGFDVQFGARPLRRAIQKLVENPLSERILDKSVNKGDIVKVDEDENELFFKTKN